MKLTYKQLKQLIKEQVSSVLLEQGAWLGGPAPSAAAGPLAIGAAPAPRTLVDLPHTAGAGMASMDRIISYESTPPAMPTTPAAVSDNARRLFDDSPTSLKSGITRLARLLSRNQDEEAAQLLGWLPQSSRSGVTRSRNIVTYATQHNDGVLGNAAFKTRVINWARRAGRVAANVGAALPSSLAAIPAGSPERQQLIQTMSQLRAQLVALGTEWASIETVFHTPVSSRGAAARPAARPAGAPLVAGATGSAGETLSIPIAERWYRRRK